MQEKIRTPKFRVSFPQVFEPKAFGEGQEPKYSISMIFDAEAQKTPEFKKLVESVKGLVQETWKGKTPKNFKNPIKKGDDLVNAEGEYYGGCDENTVMIRAATKHKPGVLNEKKLPISDPSEFYAGCYAIATLVPSAFDLQTSKGITFYLNNIMKLSEGDPLGGRVSAESEFEDIEIETNDDGDFDL